MKPTPTDAAANPPAAAQRSPKMRGFSLLEVLAVTAVMAILIAVAIPTYLGHNRRTADRDAQLNLDNAYAMGQTEAVYHGGSFPENMHQVMTDPHLSFTAGVSAAANQISVATLDGGTSPDQAVYTALSGSGICWVVVDTLGQGPTYGTSSGDCAGNQVDPATITAPGWEALS